MEAKKQQGLATGPQIDPSSYLKAFNRSMQEGGQELILGEIMGLLLRPCVQKVWVPFAPDCASLVHALLSHGVHVNGHRDAFKLRYNLRQPNSTDAVYFGTPTIVNNKALFPAPERCPPWTSWTVLDERHHAKRISRNAVDAGASVIVSGLGTGDVSVNERMQDMGPGTQTVAWKRFKGFEDWVLCRYTMPI